MNAHKQILKQRLFLGAPFALQKADKYCFMFFHPEDKHSLSVCKHHFERPPNISFELVEQLSMQEPIGIYIRGGFVIEDEKDMQTGALLNYSCSFQKLYFSEAAT